MSKKKKLGYSKERYRFCHQEYVDSLRGYAYAESEEKVRVSRLMFGVT